MTQPAHLPVTQWPPPVLLPCCQPLVLLSCLQPPAQISSHKTLVLTPSLIPGFLCSPVYAVCPLTRLTCSTDLSRTLVIHPRSLFSLFSKWFTCSPAMEPFERDPHLPQFSSHRVLHPIFLSHHLTLCLLNS